MGRAIALALADVGFDIAIVDLTRDGLAEDTLRLVAERGAAVHFETADIADLDRHDALLDGVASRFGRLDTLVNNAGVSVASRGDLLQVTPDSYDRCMGVNARAPFFLCRAFAARLVDSRLSRSPRSCIVNISSVTADTVSRTLGEYCVSKAAVSMTSRLFAVRLAPLGVPVFEIRPGIIRTEMTRGMADAYDRAIADGPGAGGPLGRAGGCRRDRRQPGDGRASLQRRAAHPGRRRHGAQGLLRGEAATDQGDGTVGDAAVSFGLDGRRALVTGAGRGIGAVLARALAAAGAHVTACARTGAEIEAVADAIRSGGGRAETLELDVAAIDAARPAIEAAGPFDILVNNAGTNRPRPFLEVEPEDYDPLLALNVRAAYFVAQAVARRLRAENRPGSIINISSQAGHIGAAGRSVYTLSKHAIEGLTKVMAIELAPFGIRVNAICPTFIETDMTRPALAEPSFRELILSRIKLGRLGRPEDLAGATVFLASDASAFMTGSSLRVDGGWTAG